MDTYIGIARRKHASTNVLRCKPKAPKFVDIPALHQTSSARLCVRQWRRLLIFPGGADLECGSKRRREGEEAVGGSLWDDTSSPRYKEDTTNHHHHHHKGHLHQWGPFTLCRLTTGCPQIRRPANLWTVNFSGLTHPVEISLNTCFTGHIYSKILHDWTISTKKNESICFSFNGQFGGKNLLHKCDQ